MKKKALFGFVGTLVFLLSWYLFIKPSDYIVTFKANTFPGAINQTLKVWGKSNFSGKILEQKDLLHVNQRLQFGDSVVDYEWTITPISDSTSSIRVSITDEKNSLKNRILIPFTNTIIEKRSKKNLLDYSAFLNNHIKKFKAKVEGEAELPPSFCAYLPAKGIQSKKAFDMMRDFPYLSSFIEENDLKLVGTPFVEITNWNIVTDSISFNFCYPIQKTDSLPEHREIKFKEYSSRKAIKAIYKGNYSTSDRAWYRILTYAEKNGIAVDPNPIEVFLDNPSLGGNELEWQAEIYMPLKNGDE
ncbi:GyrI-like domain-containing protein [Flagellimonas meridianipacifica]|uniref:Effector-binding domain-containing protein n=1 Tax=Flagellimonas meridianipacifica TaxID=1080225 RepID=A0A2T0MFZ3_9FLAO|nr:GyrI-like domain-containing protein [Allomuricauda pacifica]PRX56501.1 effector-binding domain-containing protein [Allomuricauda pacifica]